MHGLKCWDDFFADTGCRHMKFPLASGNAGLLSFLSMNDRLHSHSKLPTESVHCALKLQLFVPNPALVKLAQRGVDVLHGLY